MTSECSQCSAATDEQHGYCVFCASKILTYHIRARDTRDPCQKCHGSGARIYPSTATWRGGMGGCMMTTDVCDSCWGSGDRYRQWTNLRQLRDEEEKRLAERAVDLLARSVGASLGSTHPDVGEIIRVLENLADKRGKPATRYLPELAQGLANQLRVAVGLERRVRP